MTPATKRFLTIFLWALPLCGQSNSGELRLKITDPAGLGVKSSVELVSEVNQFRQTSATDDAGSLVAKRLPFGVYRILVEHPGFAPFSESVEVRSSIPTEYRVTLRVAPMNTSMVVQDTDTLIDPHRTGAINRIGPETLEHATTSLPGRSVIDLVNSEPGWLVEANGVLHPRGSEYQTQYVIDGIPLTDNRSPAFSSEIGADDVESMTILTANFPAEYGRKLGGVVEVVTAKDARKGFHGKVVASGGSFSTADGYILTQDAWGKNTLGVTAEGARTDRYLDPPVRGNFTNRATTNNFGAHYERDFTDKDRLGLTVSHEQARFLVPNEQIQEASGQRQDRDSYETMGILSYQRIFSTNVLGDLRVMARDVSAALWSNPFATPIIAGQNRGFREGYLKGSVTVHHRSHEWKAGVEADLATVHEKFNYRITDPTQFNPLTPLLFSFFGRAHDHEQSAFVQDLVRLGKWTLSAGIRWDHYQLLVNRNAVSPRLGIARYWSRADLVVHASYDRVFQTPAFENLLLSSSPEVAVVNPNVLRLPVKPSHGNFYEVGLTKGCFGKLKLDANYFRRDFDNYADDDLLLDTGVSFPIAFRKANIYGAEAKLEIPRWGSLSGFLSYSYMVGFGYSPVTGGLFLGDDATNALIASRFPVSQDQRNTLRTRFRYQLVPRLWAAAGASYGSGLPLEFDGNAPTVVEQYGQQILDRVNLNSGRVRPSLSVDASVGADLWRKDNLTLRLQADARNLNDRLNVINFAGLFSGTALAPPRSFALRFETNF
ncbi:MAG: TonB-dependent receptor [Candidatus Acidiferrales bacterium]